MKVHSKGEKQVVKSHVSDKQLKTLVEQMKRIARPRPKKNMFEEIRQYNLMVNIKSQWTEAVKTR